MLDREAGSTRSQWNEFSKTYDVEAERTLIGNFKHMSNRVNATMLEDHRAYV